MLLRRFYVYAVYDITSIDTWIHSYTIVDIGAFWLHERKDFTFCCCNRSVTSPSEKSKDWRKTMGTLLRGQVFLDPKVIVSYCIPNLVINLDPMFQVTLRKIIIP